MAPRLSQTTTRSAKKLSSTFTASAGEAERGWGAALSTSQPSEALSLWAGQSVALAKQQQPAADIVAELVSRL